MSMIIQSILFPQDISLDDFLQDEKLEWLKHANLKEGKTFEQYVKFTQVPVEKFEKGSFALSKIDDRGVYVIVGKALSAKDEKDALMLSGESVQRGGKPQTKTETEGGEDMELFKTKEEFVSAVTEIVKAAFEAKAAADAEAAKKLADEEAQKKEAQVPKPAETSVTPDKLAELEKTVAETNKMLKELAEKTEKLAQTPATDPASTQPDDKDPGKDIKEKSVFSGIFAKKR